MCILRGYYTSLLFSESLSPVRLLHEELQLLQEQGSHVGEVIKPMDKKKVLVKVRLPMS